MARMYVTLSYDEYQLTYSELAELMLALASLEKLSATDKIQFKRGYKRRDTKTTPVERRDTLPPQHKTVLDFLEQHENATFNTIAQHTNIPENSLGPVLFALVKNNKIEKTQHLYASDDKRLTRKNYVYRLITTA